MWIAEVIPIAKGMRKDTLSYFSVAYLRRGDIVRAPLRGKTVAAVVLDCVRAEDRKSDVRTAAFELKKISSGPDSGARTHAFFHPAFMKAVADMAAYYATGAGEVLSAMVPARIVNEYALAVHEKSNAEKATEKETSAIAAEIKKQDTTGNTLDEDAETETDADTDAETDSDSDASPQTRSEVLIFQTEDDDRLGHYRSLAREAFARRQSILFVAPGSRSVARLAAELGKGIGDYAVTLHGDLSATKEREAIEKVLHDSHVLIIVCTPGYISLARPDVGTIVIESERSGGYRGQARPFIDARRFIECYARHARIRLIRGDNFLSTETWHAFETGHYACLEQPRTRAEGPADVAIIDMRTALSPTFTPKTSQQHKDFSALISPAFSILIENAREKGEQLFVFTARKGLAPVTICGDCGTVVRCPACNRAMVLHNSPTRTFFLCHHCGERADTETRCANCQSWKLVPLGAGTDRIKEVLETRWPGITVFILDKDRAKTPSQAEKIVTAWRESPGAVLVGTEFAFSFLDMLDKRGAGIADHAVVASADALLALSDYAAYEKMMAILLETRRRARATFLVQTRVPQDPIFEFGIRGMIKEFHQYELAARKAVNYPPFSTLIRVEALGTREKIAEMMAALKSEIVDMGFACDIFPSYIKKAGGKSGLSMMIHVAQPWPHEGLVALLKSLPPNFSIMVDAEGSL